MALFKQKKPRQFNLKPRYYDEHKERLEQAYQRYEDKKAKEAGLETAVRSADARRENIHAAFHGSVDRVKADKAGKMRWGFAIGILLLLITIFFHYAR